MSIDAAAARRDARRRRILENSEKRLSKIISCDNSRGKVIAEAATSLNNQWDHSNGVIKTEKYNPLPELDETLPDEIKLFNPVETEICDDSVLLRGEHLNSTEEVGEKTEVLFWSEGLFIVFVGVFIRLMYQFNMSSMFAESLFVPFVTIFIAKYAANPSKRVSKSVKYGGMIRASLLLSGVSKDWLDTILLCIQTCVDLGHDFALFFFSFTITHIFLDLFINR